MKYIVIILRFANRPASFSQNWQNFKEESARRRNNSVPIDRAQTTFNARLKKW